MVLAQPELHFGASLPFGPEDTVFQARWMEELGYEYLAAAEHFMQRADGEKRVGETIRTRRDHEEQGCNSDRSRGTPHHR